MADKGYVIITLRKEVPDRVAGRTIYDLVKAKLADQPDVKVTGHFANHYDFDSPDG